MKRRFAGIWIPAEIWETNKLSLIEKIFFIEIDSLDNESGCYASNKYFSEFFDISKSRCSQIISSLKKKGFISVKMIKNEKKQIVKRIITVERGCLENLIRGIKKTKGGYLENSQENNTYINNIKKTSSANPPLEPKKTENLKTDSHESETQKKDLKEIYMGSNEIELSGTDLDDFKKFWDCFDYKRGKSDAAYEFMKIKNRSLLIKKICKAAKKEAERRKEKKYNSDSPIMAQTWLAGKRWEDDIYEDKKKQIIREGHVLNAIKETRNGKNFIKTSEIYGLTEYEHITAMNILEKKHGIKKDILNIKPNYEPVTPAFIAEKRAELRKILESKRRGLTI